MAMLVMALIWPASFTWARKNPHDGRRGPAQLAGEIVRYQNHSRQLQAQGKRAQPAVNRDVGGVAVIEDDGTFFFPQNIFDLDTRSLLFTRQSGGGYQVAAGAAAFDQTVADAGQTITLEDDDTREITLGFGFPFFNQTHTTVFLNSDGNLTFNAGDVAISDRDLGRFLIGEPRIAPFFQDLNPAEGGKVTVNRQPDRVVFSWVGVPRCCIGDTSLPTPIPKQTFQATLFSDGRVQYAYSGVQEQEAVVGISPGHVDSGGSLVDFSQQSGLGTSGPVAEVFAARDSLCSICVVQKFYSTHDDAYDIMLMWANFPFLTPPAFSVGGPIRNEITGIQGFSGVNSPDNVFDFAREVGSRNGRLQGLTQMNDIATFPTDPQTVFIGANNTLSVLGQEVGHRWLVSLRYPFQGDPVSNIILGRDDSHWSFFFNSEGSVMEGNAITDNGNGTFTTGPAVTQYGTLDQYVLGLRTPEEVNPSFVVINPTGTSRNPASSPQSGLTFSGTRVPVTIDQIITANGQRFPPAAMEQKDYNFAFVLVGRRGQPPTDAQIAKLNGIRQAWETIWPEYLSGRSKARTTILRGAGIYPLPAASGTGTTVAAILILDSPAPAGGVTFQMASTDGGIASVPATVTVAAGATRAAFTMQTNGAGIARISATAAGYQPVEGAVQVSSAGAATNGASFAVGAPVTPGGIVSVFGSNFAASQAAAASLPLPTTLGATSVTIGGIKAPLFFVSPTQINLQVPFDVLGSYAPLVVTNGTTTAATLPLPLSRASPGLFTTSQDGKGVAAVLHAADGRPVTAAAPARAGEFLSIFASGLGAVTPTVGSGVPASGTNLSRTRETPVVKIGGVPATVSFSGLAPTFVGLYQINVQVPAGVSGTALTLTVTLRGVDSNTATIAVQ